MVQVKKNLNLRLRLYNYIVILTFLIIFFINQFFCKGFKLLSAFLLVLVLLFLSRKMKSIYLVKWSK